MEKPSIETFSLLGDKEVFRFYTVENDNHHANRLIRFYTEPIQPLLEFGYFKKVEKRFPKSLQS